MRGHLQQRGDDSWRIKVYVGRSTRRHASATSSGRSAARSGRPSGSWPGWSSRSTRAATSAAAPMTLRRAARPVAGREEARRRADDARVLRVGRRARTCARRSADRKLASLRPIDLDRLYADAARDAACRPGRCGSATPSMRQSLEQARKWGLIARSPAVDATPPRQRRQEVTPPTVDQVRALLDAARARGSRVRHLPVGAGRHRLPARRGLRAAVDRHRPRARRAGDPPLDRHGRRRALREGHQDPPVPAGRPRRRRRSAMLREHRRRMRERALALGVRARPTTPTCSPTSRAGRGVRTCAPTGSAGCAIALGLRRGAPARPAPLRGHGARRRRHADRHHQQPPRPPRHGDDAEHLHPRPPGHRPARRRLPRQPPRRQAGRRALRWAAAQGIEVQVVSIGGALEGVCTRRGLADAIVDLREAGTSLAQNRISRPRGDRDLRGALRPRKGSDPGELPLRLGAVIDARRNRYVMLHIAPGQLTALSATVHGLAAPTVLPLAERSDLVALHLVIPATSSWEKLGHLRRLGATGIRGPDT